MQPLLNRAIDVIGSLFWIAMLAILAGGIIAAFVL